MLTEYGAGSVAGFHQDPGFIYTEEYQAELMTQNFAGFDKARNEGMLIGKINNICLFD